MSIFARYRNQLHFDGSVFRAIGLDEETANNLERLNGVRKPTKAEPCWRVPALPNNVQYMRDLGLAWTAEANLQAVYLISEALERLEASKATNAELDFDGFGMQLDPYQKAGVAYMLRAGRVLLADAMGLGKTCQALGFLFKQPEAFPALILCPSSLTNWWKAEGERCLPGRRITILKGKFKPLDIHMSDICILSKDSIADGWETADKKEVKLTNVAQALLEANFKCIIGDEIHWAKNYQAQCTKAAIKLAAGKPYRIGITGTPVQSRPQELISILQFLGRLADMGGYMYFTKTYCASKNRFNPNGGSRNELKLHERMRSSFYIRRTLDDVELELPPMRRSIVPVAIDNRSEYEFAQRKLIEWVKERAAADEKFLEGIKDLSETEKLIAIEEHKHDKAERAKKAEAMIRIGALKDVAARGKLAAALQWIDLFLESGKKLVIFAMNDHILDALREHLPDSAVITSDLAPEKRFAEVQRFQEDPKVQTLIGAMGTHAGSSPAGVGYTMTAASDSVTLQLGWTPSFHDQIEKRTHRRGQTKPTTAYYIIGADTIEHRILSLLDEKREICDAIVDGLETSSSPPLVDMLMEELEKGII